MFSNSKSRVKVDMPRVVCAVKPDHRVAPAGVESFFCSISSWKTRRLDSTRMIERVVDIPNPMRRPWNRSVAPVED